MSGPSSTAAAKTESSGGFIRALIVLGATATIILVSWVLWSSQADPFVKATLNLQGSVDKGDRLFRMNCAGCHGITAQGLVGPNLREVIYQRKDSDIINQVVEGRTPPMPSFQMEPQAMADLLAYLHTIN